MALSWNFFPDGDDIIKAALRRIRAVDPENTTEASTVQLTNGREALNFMLSAWQADGLQLWCRKEAGPFTFILDQSSYTIGASGADWTLTRPLYIYQAWIRDDNSSADTPINIYTQEEYYLQGNKTSPGTPVAIYYDPAWDGSSNQGTNSKGTIKVWPRPNQSCVDDKKLYFLYQRPFLDFNAASDELDMPQEWYEAVKLGLAYRIAPEYGMPMLEYDRLKGEAREAKELAMGWDSEKGSLRFSPSRGNR